MTVSKSEKCTNCGKTLSRRHTACIFQNSVVCVKCDRQLRHWEELAPKEDVEAARQFGISIEPNPTRRQMKLIWDEIKTKSKLENDAHAAAMGCPFKEVTNPLDEKSVITTLQKLAAQRRTALIDFVWKSNRRAKVYLVEPYALMAGSYDPSMLSLICWGCTARAGWQYYTLRGIVGVADGGSEFSPRRPVTLDSGEIEPYAAPGDIEIIISASEITVRTTGQRYLKSDGLTE